MTRRGDVVIARFPYVSGAGSKVRPAVVVQCDRLNAQIRNTLLAMVTGNVRLAGREPTQLLIDVTTPEGRQSGLLHDSLVSCNNVATIEQALVVKVIGTLPAGRGSLPDAILTLARRVPLGRACRAGRVGPSAARPVAPSGAEPPWAAARPV